VLSRCSFVRGGGFVVVETRSADARRLYDVLRRLESVRPPSYQGISAWNHHKTAPRSFRSTSSARRRRKHHENHQAHRDHLRRPARQREHHHRRAGL